MTAISERAKAIREALANHYCGTPTTSLSVLPLHDWNVISSTYSRGIDWCIHKVGRKWVANDCFGNFPLRATKAAAFDDVCAIVGMESKVRAKTRLEEEAATLEAMVG